MQPSGIIPKGVAVQKKKRSATNRTERRTKVMVKERSLDPLLESPFQIQQERILECRVFVLFVPTRDTAVTGLHLCLQ